MCARVHVCAYVCACVRAICVCGGRAGGRVGGGEKVRACQHQGCTQVGSHVGCVTHPVTPE